MTDALDGNAISASLARHWGLRAPTIQRHDRGMNSRTWIISDGIRRWVAKAVPVEVQPSFAAGLAVASLVDTAGIPSGAPEPTQWDVSHPSKWSERVRGSPRSPASRSAPH